MVQTRKQRNLRIREHRKDLSEKDPDRVEKLKLKERLRSRTRRAEHSAKSARVLALTDHRRVKVNLPRGYNRRSEVDEDIVMHVREASSIKWRVKLPQIKSTTDSDTVLCKAVGSFVNLNQTYSMLRCRNDRDLSFALKEVEALLLADQLHNTIMLSREIMDLTPHSTCMLEDPREAFAALTTWTDIHVQAIKVEAHLKSRMEAASLGRYW